MKKILITGHRGLVGSIIVPRLSAMGFEIKGYDLVDGDNILDTAKLIQRLDDCEMCVHLAGIPGPWQGEWKDYQKQNVEGTQSVIRACVETSVKRIIYMSTGTVFYGSNVDHCRPKQFPIKESDPSPEFETLSEYDRSKIICEKHLKQASKKHSITVIVLRLETPTPHASIIPSHFFGSIGENNLAEAVRASLQTDFKGYGVFNIQDPQFPNDPIFQTHDPKKWVAEHYPNVPDYTKPGESLWDISRAKNLLGYKPI